MKSHVTDGNEEERASTKADQQYYPLSGDDDGINVCTLQYSRKQIRSREPILETAQVRMLGAEESQLVLQHDTFKNEKVAAANTTHHQKELNTMGKKSHSSRTEKMALDIQMSWTEKSIQASSTCSSSTEYGFPRQHTKRDKKWNETFQKVKAYVEKSGGTINDTHHGFRRWVNTQRETYKRHCRAAGGSMTEERIKLLESIGINWKRHDKVKDCIWKNKFDRIKVYSETKGRSINDLNHDLVPWVNTQRVTYKLFHKTGKGGMTEERIKLLESIGIDWEPGIPLIDREDMWHEKFEALKSYKAIYGHTNVPTTRCTTTNHKNHALGRWVAYQRTKYRRKTLSDYKVQLLESIGFTWWSNSRAGRRVRK